MERPGPLWMSKSWFNAAIKNVCTCELNTGTGKTHIVASLYFTLRTAPELSLKCMHILCAFSAEQINIFQIGSAFPLRAVANYFWSTSRALYCYSSSAKCCGIWSQIAHMPSGIFPQQTSLSKYFMQKLFHVPWEFRIERRKNHFTNVYICNTVFYRCLDFYERVDATRQEKKVLIWSFKLKFCE